MLSYSLSSWIFLPSSPVSSRRAAAAAPAGAVGANDSIVNLGALNSLAHSYGRLPPPGATTSQHLLPRLRNI